jgi:hypothetical protein
MANTFNRSTRASLTAGDVTSDPSTDVLNASAASALIIISILIANKSGGTANVDVYLVTSSGDDTYILRGAPIPSGNALEVIQGSRIVLTANDVIRARGSTAGALDITVSYLTQT